MGSLQAKILEWVAFPLPGDLEPRSPTLWANSLPSGPPWMPFDTFSQIHYYNALGLLPFTILIELLEDSYYVDDFYFYWTALV